MSQRHDAPTVNLRGVRADLAPEAASPAEALAARLGEEMAAAWRRGERPLAEEYLARHPELAGDPQAAVCLIYDEVLLRGEFDAEQPPSEVLRRFPQWHTELGLLLDCHRLLQQPQPAGPRYPEPGETLGDLRLLRELGRGAQGRVVLAVQSFLADRPVVLKMSPVSGQEHLTLARLQHTHVAPLYWVQDFANRGLRVLCMPYLGGATLHHLLAELAAVPPAERAGRHLVAALDRAQEAVRQATGVAVPAQGPARARLLRLGYVEAVCWLGACLCDALHHAHERGLVHLDVKPSNVLLAADGEPLLLDFHLAREPLAANDPVPEWFGGTLDYMSPEQRRALAAVKAHQPIPQDVDRRSDVYSLGLVLYEALGGEMGLADQASLPPLYRCNPQVSVGLSDVVHKCLAEAPAARYQDAAAVAADLRRHLAHWPLQGVANRSAAERWHKWRQRRPQALPLLVLAAVVGLGVAGATAGGVLYIRGRAAEAAEDRRAGEEYLAGQKYSEAAARLEHGLNLARTTPGCGDQAAALAARLKLARRAEAAQTLHRVADQVRFRFDGAALPPAVLRALEGHCRTVWEARGPIADRAGAELPPQEEGRIAADLLDLAVCRADLLRRLGESRAALMLLAETEAALGTSPALMRERQACAEALGDTALAREAARPPQTAWEHYTLGRTLLRGGDLTTAAAELRRALDLQPDGFWPRFSWGVCAFQQGRHDEAAAAFDVCVALAPHSAECWCNRARARAALDRADEALADYGRALDLDGGLAAAALGRAVLLHRLGRYAEALADLRRARDNGADPATVHYNEALAYAAQQDRAAALASVRRALEIDPSHAEARKLEEQLR